MMNKRLIFLASVGAGALVFSLVGSSSALNKRLPNCPCTYYVPDLENSGDDFYSKLKTWSGGNTWCSGTMFSLTGAYGMDGIWEWGPGYGYLQCDITKPFGRTMNAITALRTASTNTITGTLYDYQTGLYPLLDWAYLWTANKMDATKGYCEYGDDKPRDASQIGSSRVELYVRRSSSCSMAFFHGLDAVERAGVLVHETRHIGGPSHCCDDGKKDYYFGDGGAYEFQATWLRQFGQEGSVFTTLLRCSALDSAKKILQNNFVIPGPDFALPPDC